MCKIMHALLIKNYSSHVLSDFNFIRDEEILHPTTPTVLDEGEADILNLSEDNADIDDEEEGLEVNQKDEDGMDTQEGADVVDEFVGVGVETAVDSESRGDVNQNTSAKPDDGGHDENTDTDFVEVKTSLSVHDVEKLQTESTDGEMDSPINRIHSEILELTRRISLPEAGILNLLRATEEAENEAKRQLEAAASSSPSKESLLLRAMAEHGSTDFSIHGAFRGLSSRDAKQTSTSPWAAKAPAVSSKTKLQGDEGGKASVAEKESFSTSPRKDRTITMNSEMGASGDVNAKPQTAEELPQTAGKGTETRKSEGTDRDMLGMFSFIIFSFFFFYARYMYVDRNVRSDY